MIHLLAEILPILIKASPTVATALGGPLAGLAMSLVSYAFGVDPKQPSDLVSKVMSDVPGATTILQALETQHGDFLKSVLSSTNNLASAEITIKLSWNQPCQG